MVKYDIKLLDALHLRILKRNNISLVALEGKESDKIDWAKRL